MQEAAERLEEPEENEGLLNPAFVRTVSEAIEAGDVQAVRAAAGGLHAADLADLIEFLRPELRPGLIQALGPDFKADALSELQEPIRDELLEALPNKQLAAAVSQLDSDDAVYLLEDLGKSDRDEILAQMPEIEQAAVRRSLEYPEDSAGRLMQSEFVAVPPFWSVGRTIDYMREDERLPEEFVEIYVVNPSFHLIGAVSLSRLLRTKRPVPVDAIARTDIRTIRVSQDQEEVARDFERYNLLSAPVVDDDGRLVGVITGDDIVEVIQEEAEEDLYALGGVSLEEDISESVFKVVGRRFAWLFVNLLTAILASMIIGLFDATIQQRVALAVLMPIVASMGGNAATQTMTVAVRALATRNLTSVNALRVIAREAMVGMLNGLMFSLIMAGVALVWFGSDGLGIVIAVAMVVNMFVAGLGGILIPLAVNRLKLDPAVASGVFVTTVTDVVGFFSFLGFATLWFR